MTLMIFAFYFPGTAVCISYGHCTNLCITRNVVTIVIEVNSNHVSVVSLGKKRASTMKG